jgi:hypothetical protein
LRKYLEIGKSLEIAGQRGVLKGITATHVLLESTGEEVSISNATFLEQVAKTIA